MDKWVIFCLLEPIFIYISFSWENFEKNTKTMQLYTYVRVTCNLKHLKGPRKSKTAQTCIFTGPG